VISGNNVARNRENAQDYIKYHMKYEIIFQYIFEILFQICTDISNIISQIGHFEILLRERPEQSNFITKRARTKQFYFAQNTLHPAFRPV
jgi:hypothetical protein